MSRRVRVRLKTGRYEGGPAIGASRLSYKTVVSIVSARVSPPPPAQRIRWVGRPFLDSVVPDHDGRPSRRRPKADSSVGKPVCFTDARLEIQRDGYDEDEEGAVTRVFCTLDKVT